MKTLSEYTVEKHEAWKRYTAPTRPAGVKCDKCGTELTANNQETCLSNPPCVRVWCTNCGYQGYM